LRRGVLEQAEVTKVNELGETICIAGICGSLRTGSYTRLALEIALQGAAEVGAETQLIDLAAYDLVFCKGAGDEHAYPEGIHRLRREVQAVQGILLGTPIYHGSFSGVLKNALDLMGFREFEGKMVGLVGVSGGRMGAINALDSLRAIGRVLHAWVIPEQASIPEGWKAFDASGKLKDEELEQRLMELGRQVARFAYLHGSDQTKAFLRAWESAPANPGGGG
jgi:NAD(P)H-dependent FMN reductase